MLQMTRTMQMSRCDCLKLKKTVQELGFSLIETNLYLDSHPCCQEALEYFHTLQKQYVEAKENYEQSCGPLTSFASHGDGCFGWVQTPWPWELEAN